MQGGSIMQKVKHELINPQPGKPPRYDNIVIMVGEDRANMPLAGALMKAVTKFPGYEHVKVTLETIPRTRPISFTKLRDVLKNPNATPEQQYAVWAQGFNEKKLGKDWILNLMDISRKGMGVSQAAPAAPAALPPQPVAEQRLFSALVRPRVYESDPAIRSIQHLLNKKGANLDIDGEFGPLTKKSINKFLPKAPTGLAPEPDKTTAVQGEEIKIPTEDGITWQDIRLMAGEGKLTKKTVLQAIAVIRKQRRPQGVAEGKVGADPYDRGYHDGQRMGSNSYHNPYSRGDEPTEWDEYKSGFNMAQIELQNDLEDNGFSEGVAEGLSRRDQQDVAAIRAAIARLQAQLSHPNADRDAIQQSIAHEKKRLALYGVTEDSSKAIAQAASRLTDPKDGATAKLRAAGDKRREDDLKSRDIAKKNEAMLPKSAFAGSDKHKLGPAAHAKGKQKGPVKKGQFVGGMEEAKKKGADGKACWKGYRYNGTENGKDKCVPVSEDVEKIMGALIESILRK
jgi:hypothetical protein